MEIEIDFKMLVFMDNYMAVSYDYLYYLDCYVGYY